MVSKKKDFFVKLKKTLQPHIGGSGPLYSLDQPLLGLRDSTKQLLVSRVYTDLEREHEVLRLVC